MPDTNMFADDSPNAAITVPQSSTNDAFGAEKRCNLGELRNGIRPKYLKMRKSAVVC